MKIKSTKHNDNKSYYSRRRRRKHKIKKDNHNAQSDDDDIDMIEEINGKNFSTNNLIEIENKVKKKKNKINNDLPDEPLYERNVAIFTSPLTKLHNSLNQEPEKPARFEKLEKKFKSNTYKKYIQKLPRQDELQISKDIKSLKNILSAHISNFENLMNDKAEHDLSTVYDNYIESLDDNDISNNERLIEIAKRYGFYDENDNVDVDYFCKLFVMGTYGGKFAEMNFDIGSMKSIMASQLIIKMMMQPKYRDTHVFGAIRPPGHHKKGHGFCYKSNVAYILKLLKENDENAKALIIDVDVHHGDSTLEHLNYKTVEYNNTVTMIDIYMPAKAKNDENTDNDLDIKDNDNQQQTPPPPPFFPFDNDHLKPDDQTDGQYIGVPLDGGEDGDAYLEHLDNGLAQADNDYDVIIISFGTDACVEDQREENNYIRLDNARRTALLPSDYARIVKRVHEKYPNARIIIETEGGYHPISFANASAAVVAEMAPFNRPSEQYIDDNQQSDNNIHIDQKNGSNSNSSYSSISNTLNLKKKQKISGNKRSRNNKSYHTDDSDDENETNYDEFCPSPLKKQKLMHKNSTNDKFSKNKNRYNHRNGNKHKSPVFSQNSNLIDNDLINLNTYSNKY